MGAASQHKHTSVAHTAPGASDGTAPRGTTTNRAVQDGQRLDELRMRRGQQPTNRAAPVVTNHMDLLPDADAERDQSTL
eukprot:SAG11_NODE_33483_length_277_cov_0.578652_1_plen_78_part_01